MYYVLRTHGSVESPWGFTTIALFKTKKEAKSFCASTMKTTEYNTKLIIVKLQHVYEVASINYTERKAA